MGRRAKKAPVVTKKRPKLAKRFKCPFCANEDVVECKMDFKRGLGTLNCRLCAASYQMPIHHLHEPVDVFSEWLDDCEAAANPNRQQQDGGDGGVGPDGGGTAAAAGLYDDDDDDDDDLLEPSGLGSSKPSAKGGGGGKKKSSSTSQPQTYTDLGLDDSDDDDDDD